MEVVSNRRRDGAVEARSSLVVCPGPGQEVGPRSILMRTVIVIFTASGVDSMIDELKVPSEAAQEQRYSLYVRSH